VEPLETEFGRKRTINQSNCNKDYSCVKGFCPSFVSIDGGVLRKRAPADLGDLGNIAEPAAKPSLDDPYNIAVAGVGGTGVLTIGALLGMAAHIEGKASMILDMSGLAQKGGAVLSHVRLSQNTEEVACSRIVTGTSDMLLAADEVVGVSKDAITLCSSDRTVGIINTHLIPIADFIRNRDFDFQRGKVNHVLEASLKQGSMFFDFTHVAEALLGDSIATNMMMMGYAYQRGLLPLNAESIEQAIAVNAVSVKMNTEAFRLGRIAASDPARLANMLHEETKAAKTQGEMTLDELIAHRAAHLTAYQNAALADRYRKLVADVASVVRQQGQDEALPRAVAIGYAKLLAYKDEYEVARLFTDGSFEKELREQFEGNFKLSYHLAPPLLPAADDGAGRPRKKTFGPWMLGGFKLLAKLKGLRGTAFDPFGYAKDRRMERELITEYESDVRAVLAKLSDQTAPIALALLSLPEDIRGYGPVKEKSVTLARAKRAGLLKDLADPPPATTRSVAAE
jgi:indolepyruvate ferredoxin oxidoreductase